MGKCEKNILNLQFTEYILNLQKKKSVYNFDSKYKINEGDSLNMLKNNVLEDPTKETRPQN